MSSLYQLTETYARLQEIAELAGDDYGDVIAEAFDELGDELTSKIENCCKIIAQWTSDANAATLEADRLKERAKACDNRIKHLKARMLAAMEATDTKGVKTPLFGVSLRAGSKSVEIDADARLDDKFMRFSEPVPNKKAISDALKNDEEVPGCRFIVGSTSLVIK